jgi:hypothetical protein
MLNPGALTSIGPEVCSKIATTMNAAHIASGMPTTAGNRW